MKLLDMVIEFSSTGSHVVQKALHDLAQDSQKTQNALAAIKDKSMLDMARAVVKARQEQEKLNQAVANLERLATKGRIGIVLEEVGKKAAAGFRLMERGVMAAVNPILSLGMQAVRSSAYGMQFSIQMERMGRAIGGLFAPEIEKGLNLLDRLATKLEKLTPQQRQQASYGLQSAMAYKMTAGALSTFLPFLGPVGIGLTALGAAGITSEGGFKKLAATLKPIMDAVQKLAKALGSILVPVIRLVGSVLTEVIKGFEKLFGWIGKIWDKIKGFGKAIGDVFSSKETKDHKKMLDDIERTEGKDARIRKENELKLQAAEQVIKSIDQMEEKQKKKQVMRILREGAVEDALKAREKLGGLSEQRGPLVPRAAGGMEDVSAAWTRIAMASRNVGTGGKSIAEQHLDEAKEQTKKLVDVKDAVERKAPPIKQG